LAPDSKQLLVLLVISRTCKELVPRFGQLPNADCQVLEQNEKATPAQGSLFS
jgi:hypothetical protein